MITNDKVKELIFTAKAFGNTSEWSPVSAEGRNQLERIKTLYTHLMSNIEVVEHNIGNPVKHVIADPNTICLLERLGIFTILNEDGNEDTVSKVGLISGDNIEIYRYADYNSPFMLIVEDIDTWDTDSLHYIEVQGLVQPSKCDVCKVEHGKIKRICHTKAFCPCQVDMKPEALDLWLCPECEKTLRA